MEVSSYINKRTRKIGRRMKLIDTEEKDKIARIDIGIGGHREDG